MQSEGKLYVLGMLDLTQLEQTLKALPTEQKWELAHWLLEDLHTAPSYGSMAPASPKPLPDYATRRRQIFGDRVIANVVLAARGEERW